MFYAVIHRPEVDVTSLKEIREKYDPTYSLVDPHVTLVFPVSAEGLDIDKLTSYIEDVARTTKSFKVRLNELDLSWDQWLSLTPSSGWNEFTELHDKLYGDMLSSFLRSDIEYIPHVSLGHFTVAGSEYELKDPKDVPLDEVKYQVARKEIENKELDLSYTATSIELISINEEFSKTQTIKTFMLS